MVVTYFLLIFWDLTLILTFPGTTFVLNQYSSQAFTSTLCEFEPLAVGLADPRAQNVKRFFTAQNVKPT